MRIGRQKSLSLFAKFPDVVSEETEVEVVTSNSNCLPIRSKSRLIPIAGTNTARAKVSVHARKIAQQEINIQARVHGRLAETTVKIVPDTPDGPPIIIELRDKEFGSFRAIWAEDPNRPNVLSVSARHESLRRYLGPDPDFIGQSAPHFRILLAEIVAESTCRKALGLEAKERPRDFEWANLGKNDEIADSVLTALHKRMRGFVAEAHAIMLSDGELRRITNNGRSTS